MLSSRHRRSSWASDGWQREHGSMFRTLAGHWRPVVASLRELERARDPRTRFKKAIGRKQVLPSFWSPWLNVK
jgi:hypothetical protein